MRDKPEWLRIRSQNSSQLKEVEVMLKRLNLNTVCHEAGCPNKAVCFNSKTATFIILGRLCTRNCSFCNIEKGKPMGAIDVDEPQHVAVAVKELGLKHAVITSVTRDDLEDGGATHFAQVIDKIRENCDATVEVLIPDFRGNWRALETVVNKRPEVINHNVETIPRLYSNVRPLADYKRSLNLLRKVKELDDRIFTKSGLMVGLGEKPSEIIKVFEDLRNVGCDFLTVGQYLSPSNKHYPIQEYVTPEQFEIYKGEALKKGFIHVECGPLVRSSYQAADALSAARTIQNN